MRRLVQGNQAPLIIRQVLVLVKLRELELSSVFHFLTGMIILSSKQLPSLLQTKRFNRHVSGWNLLTDICWKHFCVTFFFFWYICPYCFCLIMVWLDLQVCINFAGPIWNRTVQDGHYQGSKLTLANSQNASDFDNLRVRKISTSKRLRVRIIHVSQTKGNKLLVVSPVC